MRSLRGHGPPPTSAWAASPSCIGTMVVNLFVTRYERHKAHELASQLLHADAHHTQSDLYASAAVIASFVAVRARLRLGRRRRRRCCSSSSSATSPGRCSGRTSPSCSTPPSWTRPASSTLARAVQRRRGRPPRPLARHAPRRRAGSAPPGRLRHEPARRPRARAPDRRRTAGKVSELSDVVIHIEPAPARPTPSRRGVTKRSRLRIGSRETDRENAEMSPSAMANRKSRLAPRFGRKDAGFADSLTPWPHR